MKIQNDSYEEWAEYQGSFVYLSSIKDLQLR